MRTKVEINGFEIEIEEKNGVVSVTAAKGGEVIEEFSLISKEEEEESADVEKEDEVKNFGDFGQEEEEDFKGEEEDVEEEDEELEDKEEDVENEDEDEDEDEEGKLESFQSFINKNK